MKRRLDITSLGVECDEIGGAKVTIWCKCYSVEDIDDCIEWLKLARTLMEGWEAIRRTPKTE